MTQPATFPDPIPGIIPFGTVTVFAGAPGVGKTTMLIDWIARWQTGRPIWGHPTSSPTQFCYLASDRSWTSNQKWFDAVGISHIPHYSLADDPHFDLKELMQPFNALDLFHRALDVVNDGRPPMPGAHVIVDPASPVFVAGNQNAARDVARTLLGMAREAKERLITLTITAHFGKQTGDKTARYVRPQDRIAGSFAFSGFSDTQMYLVEPEPPEYPYNVFGWNPRHNPAAEYPCMRDPKTGLFIPYDLLKDDLIAGQVLNCFEPTGPTAVSIIRQRAQERYGYSPGTVKRALTRLIECGQAAKVKHGWYARVKIH